MFADLFMRKTSRALVRSHYQMPFGQTLLAENSANSTLNEIAHNGQLGHFFIDNDRGCSVTTPHSYKVTGDRTTRPLTTTPEYLENVLRPIEAVRSSKHLSTFGCYRKQSGSCGPWRDGASKHSQRLACVRENHACAGASVVDEFERYNPMAGITRPAFDDQDIPF